MDAHVANPQPIQILFGTETNVGRMRETNEDSFLCAPLHPGTSDESILLVVSDGVGGGKAGEVASRITVDGLLETLTERLAREAPPTDRHSWLDEAVRALDARVRTAAAASAACQDMGATVSILWLQGGHGWWAHAGDSRIYRLRNRTLEQISHDQSPVGRLRAEGQITEEQARRHPYRHVIDQCLGGGGGEVDPESGTITVEAGDVFLLCSDGVSDGLWDREIGEILRRTGHSETPQETARRLVQLANDASGKDNITAIVAYAKGPPTGRPSRRQGWLSLFSRTP